MSAETFHFAARLCDIPPAGQKGLAVWIGETRVAVFEYQGQYFAVEDRCPHQGTPLSWGHVDQFILYCDAHYWQFDLKRGAAPEVGPKEGVVACFKLDHFPVEVRGEELWVSLIPVT